MKKGISIGVLGAGILALFSFRNVKDTDGAQPPLAKIGTCSIQTGDCANFTETCRTSPDKFAEWRRTWSTYPTATSKKSGSSKEKKVDERVTEFSHALERF